MRLLPSLAQAGGGKTTKQLEVSVFSSEKNSLCVEPKDGSIFANPGPALNFKPLEAGTLQKSNRSRDRRGMRRTERTHPIAEGGEPGGPSGFKYVYGNPPKERPLYESHIAGAQWVTVYAGANSGHHDPAYYIYNAQFKMKCTKEAVLTGEFAADNAAGVYLNGHHIGQDAMAKTSANFTPKSFTDAGKYFLAAPAKNTLQFVVYGTLPRTRASTSRPPRNTARASRSNGARTWAPKRSRRSRPGKLTFNTAVGPVTCKKSDAGNIWNPTEGNGLDETELVRPLRVLRRRMPERGDGESVRAALAIGTDRRRGVIRDKSTGVTLTVECEGRSFTYSGEIKPEFVNATKKTWGYDEFDAESGSLQSPEGLAPLTISGKDSMAGFLNFEPITSTSTTTKATKQENLRSQAARQGAGDGREVRGEGRQANLRSGSEKGGRRTEMSSGWGPVHRSGPEFRPR